MRQLVSAFCTIVLLQGLPVVVQAQAQPTLQSPSNPTEQVVAAGLMTNLPDGQFHPKRFISRAELASILVKTFRLNTQTAASQANAIAVEDVPTNHWAFNDIQVVLKTSIMKGYRDNKFFPNQKVTRAEAFVIFAQAYGVFQFPSDAVAEILAPYPDAASIPDWAKKSWATALNEGFVNTNEQNNVSPLQPMTRVTYFKVPYNL